MRAKLIVNGAELGDLYRDFAPIIAVSSSVSESEIVEEVEVPERSENDPFNIVFVGRPSKEKGFHTLIDALSMLISKGENVRLHLIGVTESDLHLSLSTKIPAVVLAVTEFYGFVSWGPKFIKVIRSSHVLIMCSVSEGTPRVIIESRALGCPIIATRVGGVVSSVSNMVDGILVEPGDHLGIANAVTLLRNDEGFRRKLIIEGLKTVHGHTIENFAEKFLVTLRENQLDES